MPAFLSTRELIDIFIAIADGYPPLPALRIPLITYTTRPPHAKEEISRHAFK